MKLKADFRSVGFTLAELLIAMMILGEIATFTIPKVLISQRTSRYNAVAKEMAGAISQAYQLYLNKNGPSINVHGNDLTPYMNYIADGDGRLLDGLGCAYGYCLLMPNGSALYYIYGNPGTNDGITFGGSTPQNYITFWIDPDSGSNGAGWLELTLYYNGRVSTAAKCNPATDHYNWSGGIDANGGACFGTPADPSWFSW